jgi:DNA-binding CsgD family transcriptional regulator
MTSRPLLEAIEHAYDLELPSRDWLSSLTRQLQKVLGASGPAIAIEFDSEGPIDDWFVDWAAPDLQSHEARWLGSILGCRELRVAMHGRLGPPHLFPSASSLATALGAPVAESPFGLFADRFGIPDVVGVNANDGSRRGVFFAMTGNPRRALEPRLSRVLPHVAAALRIRRGVATVRGERSLEGAPHGAAAILDENGILRDGEVNPSDRDMLRHAAVTRDRLRRRQGDEDDALGAWTPLVDGRWSLVDSFERNGKRWVLAVPNLPHVRDPRALSPMERTVFSLVVRGRQNKTIAFELGISEGTVAAYLRDVRYKLGAATVAAAVATTVERRDVTLGDTALVALVCDVDDSTAGLTGAERAVLELAVLGHSNVEIARRRGSSVRTVANQLASVYGKLNVGSRRELRARLARRDCARDPRPSGASGGS